MFKLRALLILTVCLCVFWATTEGKTCQTVKKTPYGLYKYGKDKIGQCFAFEVKGTRSGLTWGVGEYSADSAINKAAVHDGQVGFNQKKVVFVEIVPGKSKYPGGWRNRVYSAWRMKPRYATGYKFLKMLSKPPGRKRRRGCKRIHKTPYSLKFLGQDTIGRCFAFSVVGSRRGGTVYGKGVYSAHSALSVAAVHAGKVKVGERKIVLVVMEPGKSSYQGGWSNYVTSRSRKADKLSFRFVNMKKKKH